MTTIVELIRGTEAVRDRAEAADGYVRMENSRYAAGTKTLMFSAAINSESKSSSRYSAVIMFQGVEFADSRRGSFSLPFEVNGKRVYVEKPKMSKHDVRIRCSCTDYTHTWAWWNNKHDALFGKKFPPYRRKTNNRPQRNKVKQPGMCKHLLALIERLRNTGIISR
ncbi:hypothetical protein [Pseudoalteromonas umbrosa]|uniref:hypothetical protein n=1 Tax=Pseudoalteromonas umbrosa TaxID=3048489 RepID=UPI0024C42E89|nr:hypothetical protein [Pseudoalteromonas sp. B95]MDK1290187.1 hypothetical protein [Pseudoalteromonas sp. B95]